MRKLQAILTALTGMAGFSIGCFYADWKLTVVSLSMFILALGYDLMRQEDESWDARANAEYREYQARKKG